MPSSAYILRSYRICLSSVPGLPVHPARHDNLTSIYGKKRGLELWLWVFPCLRVREEFEITMITTPRYSRKSLSAHCLVLGPAGWLGMTANHHMPYSVLRTVPQDARHLSFQFCGGFTINVVPPSFRLIDARASAVSYKANTLLTTSSISQIENEWNYQR